MPLYFPWLKASKPREDNKSHLTWCEVEIKRFFFFFFFFFLTSIFLREEGFPFNRPGSSKTTWVGRMKPVLLLSSHWIVSYSLRPRGQQHTRFSCPLPAPRICSNSCLLIRWCHPTISFSVAPFLLSSTGMTYHIIASHNFLEQPSCTTNTALSAFIAWWILNAFPVIVTLHTQPVIDKGACKNYQIAECNQWNQNTRWGYICG